MGYFLFLLSGTRFVHTSEGKFLVTRIVPCPKCLLCVPADQNDQGPDSPEPGASSSLHDRLSKVKKKSFLVISYFESFVPKYKFHNFFSFRLL